MSRAGPDPRTAAVTAAVVVPALAFTLWNAHRIAYVPDGLPTWDSAGYLLEGDKLREYLVWGDWVGLIGQLLRPDLHPPLHALVLGAWMAALGNGLAVARAYPVAAYIAGAAGVVALGRQITRSWTPGLLAALVFGAGLASLDLLCTPMTESSALWVQLLALGTALRLADRADARSRLTVGAAVFAAGMVRYNLWPMLLAPLYAHHAWVVWRRRGGLRRLLDPSVLLWAAPTVVGVGVWQLIRPELATSIQKFLENRSSGIPFWSVENLAWVPLQTRAEFLGSWVLTAPLFALFALGLARRAQAALRRADAEGERAEQDLDLLRIFVVASVVALTIHDFKVVRNLHTVLPLLYLCAAVELTRWRPRGVPAALAALPPLVAWTAWQNTATLPALADRTDFKADPVVRQTLEFIEQHARESKRVWVTGWVFRISPNVIDWWLRTHAVPAKLKLDQPLFGEQTRTGADASWNEQYPAWVAGTLLTPELLPQTTYITLQTAPGTRYADDWKAFGNNYARVFSEQDAGRGLAAAAGAGRAAGAPIVPEIDRLSFVDQGLMVRAYRAGGTPSAATLASREHPPDAADDADVQLPAGTPLQRDTLHGLATAWHVYPAAAVAQVQIERVASALTLRIPAPVADLQLCSDVAPRPVDPSGASTFRAVVNLSTVALDGKAWLHVRGMGADRTLTQRTGANAGPDITQAGPLAADGAQLFEREVALDPASSQVRTCVVLGGVTGTLTLNDVAFYPSATPWVHPPAAAAATPAAPAAPGAAQVFPADDVGVTLPAGAPVFREPFNRDVTGWKVVTPGATDITTRRDGSDLVVTVTRAQTPLQLCGPVIPVDGPLDAVAHLQGEGLDGHGVFFHWRGLDRNGVLAAAGSTPAIVMEGPLRGSDALRAAAQLRFDAAVTQVRPCLVLDGAVGTVRLRDLAVARLAPDTRPL